MSSAHACLIVKADYSKSEHRNAIEDLMSQFALDPSGGGIALPTSVLGSMVRELAQRPYAFTILALSGQDAHVPGAPMGLCHCFECYSTFAAKGIVNIHDCFVSSSFRRQGVNQLLLRGVEEEARSRSAGKLTLEVLEHNSIAMGSYAKFGFAAYELDPAMGKAMFWQKVLSGASDSEEQASAPASVSVTTADYANAVHGQAITNLIAEYSLDPMGGSEAIPDESLNAMVSSLAKRPYAFSILAFAVGANGEEQAVGVCNCFEAFSTFTGKAIANIHDCYVAKDYRGRGVGQSLLRGVEKEARARGAGKLTLEVLENNTVAQKSYAKFGFAPYELADGLGRAMFWQKMIEPVSS